MQRGACSPLAGESQVKSEQYCSLSIAPGRRLTGLVAKLQAWSSGATDGANRMIYRGVEYTVAVSSEPGVWQWCFQIGDTVMSGKTSTMLSGMASRRAQLKIDIALRRIQIPIPATR